MDDRYEIPYSWLSIPITVMGKIKAYFVVVEATSFIDYFDQFAIRISFLLLQSIFEQLLFFESVGDTDFEKFANDVLHNILADQEKINKRAIDIDIDISKKYYTLELKQIQPDFASSNHKDIINRTIRNAFQYEKMRMCFVDENSILIALQSPEAIDRPRMVDSINKKIDALRLKLKDNFEAGIFMFGFNDRPELISKLQESYDKCGQAIRIGQLVYPEDFLFQYSKLGPLAWIRIEDRELQRMVNDMKRVFDKEDNEELLETLKYYLDCKMNYSLTSKKMFIHINTVRKRIDKVRELLDLDFDEPISRLKLELFLILAKKTD